MKKLESHRNLFLTAALLCSVGCSSSKSDDSNPWEGHTYVLAISESSWTDPPGVGQDIGPFVPRFAIQVEGSSGDDLDVLLGAATADGKQDPCGPTTTAKAVSKSASGFELGPIDVPVYVANLDEQTKEGPKVIAPIYGLTMSNVLPNGSTPATQGKFTGTMDFREVYSLFTLLMPPTPDKVCTTLADQTEGKAQCAPCPKDNQPYCLTVKAEGIGATELSTSIQAVDNSSAQKCLE